MTCTRALTVAAAGIICILAAGCTAVGSAGTAERFHVVECGHSSPDTLYYARNLKDLERRGHNGTSLNIKWPREGAGNLGMAPLDDCLNWRTWTNIRITDEMIADAVVDLKSAPSDHFTSNMIPIFTSPRETSRSMDWYDDAWWDVICHNATQLARLAREGACMGIMLDMEEYGARAMWTYDGLRSVGRLKDRTYEEVKVQVRERGREYARTLCSVYPDITVWTFFAWSQDLVVFDRAEKQGKDKPTPLLGSFLDGMLEGSTDQFILVDGQESSYYYTTKEQFERGADLVRRRGLQYSTVAPELYKQKVRVGFGLYIDARGAGPYSRVDPEKNYWTPGRLQRAIYWALRKGDGYVWTWSEKPVWWVQGPRGKPVPPGKFANENQTGIPVVYWEAVRKAFHSPGSDRTVPRAPPDLHFMPVIPASSPDRTVPAGTVDPDPKLARFIRFEKPAEEDVYKPVPIPNRFTEIAKLPTDGWVFKTDPFEEGVKQEWNLPSTPTDDWRQIKIGAWYERQGVDYDGTAWYRRDVTIPRLPDGKRIYLFFGAVDESLWCYINGKLVAWHDGDGNKIWNVPFALDVTGELPSSATCTIVFRTLDTSGMGGIWKTVTIVAEK